MVTTSRQGQMLLCATGICALLFFIIPSSTRTSSQLLSFARQSSNTGDEAFLTVLSGLQYFAGALTLGHSLDLHAGIRKRRKLALVPHQAIDEPEHVRMLETAGWEIIPVAQLDLPGQVDWHFVDMLTKLYAFNLTSFSRISIIDSDTLVVGSLDEAFTLLKSTSPEIRLAAALAPTKPLITEWVTDKFAGHFNAGVLFLKPSTADYDALVAHSQDSSYYRIELAEQNLLNEYFGGRWLGLPCTYNLISLYMGRPEYWDALRPQTKILHFAGPEKPWHFPAGHDASREHESIQLWRATFKDLVRTHGFEKQHFLAGKYRSGIVNFDWDALMSS